MPPVARLKHYERGTPQRQLQDALDARFANAEKFFVLIAKELTIRQDSASGAYYGFLAGTRALPKAHREIYRRELSIDDSVLDAIDDGRTITTPVRRDRLEELSDKLGDSLAVQARLVRQVRALQARVRKLEAQRGAVAAEAKSPRSRSAR